MVTAAPPSKVAGSPRSDDDKAGTPLAGLSCSCWVLHKPIEKSSAWGQKTPYYNPPTQDGLRGHFVLRAIGKRFRKDRTAVCKKVVGMRFALDSSLEGAGFEPVWGFSCQAVVLGCGDSFLFGAGEAVFRPVAWDQVRGARGRGQGTETVAKLGGFAAQRRLCFAAP